MRTRFSTLGLFMAAAYAAVAVGLLAQGLQVGTFSGVYWLIAAFPWSYIVAAVLPSGQMTPAMIGAGVLLNVALFYWWGRAWESWWRGRRGEGHGQ